MGLTTSQRVRAEDFDQPWLKSRIREMAHDPTTHNRKLWEWAFIAQIYRENAVQDGKALGFGCGKEFIPAWLAAQGAYVIATDLPSETVTEDWTETNQHSSELDSLGWKGVCDEETFRENVEFRPVDMTDIPDDLIQGEFDFVWSSGSLEHIGSLQLGADFVCEQMKCLRPGGIAVHTTEFNFGNMEGTINSHNLALYRSSDLRSIEEFLTQQGDYLWPLDLVPGTLAEDNHVALYPYTEPHLSLKIGDFLSTSVALVIQKGGSL